MFTQKTKLQLCAKNLTGVEHDLVAVTYPSDLVGAINNGAGYAIGTTALTVDGFGGGDIPTGCILGIAGDPTTYYVSTGGSATAIELDPPLRYAVLDNAVVTIYPHFDITAYWTNDVEIGLQAEFTQAELIFDRPIKIELFNQNSIFYDRDTHSTGWTASTAYFSTYNAQGDTDNQYIRISFNRNGAGYTQKYNGKIIQHTLELDEINHSVSFECESVFYGLKDNLVAQIEGLYNLHKYTTTTRKTKTPSGFYVDVIKTLFQSVGVQDKSFTVTNKEKSNGFNYCVLTIGAHTIQIGELITVNIGDNNFDGTHIVYLTSSTTISYYINKDPYGYTKDDVNATVAAGGSSFVLQAGLSPASSNYVGYCKVGADTTVYDFYYDSGTKTVNVTPVLAAEATINADVYLSYATIVASGAASGTVTAHRVFFDLNGTAPTDYFSITHQGHSYNLYDLMWITEKWMVQDVEAETGFDLIAELCLQLLGCACIDYKAGIAYGYFRSKVNTSSSKVTLTSSKIIGRPRLMGNWPFYSPDGVVGRGDIIYWFDQSSQQAFCYSEDLASGDYQRYLSETPSTSKKAYERYDTSVCADSFNSLTIGDQIIFSGDETVYRVTGVSGDVVDILPPLRQSIRLGEKFYKLTDKTISLNYSACCNLKLKYPNIFLTDSTNKTIKRYWNNGTATLGIHPMSYYTSEIIYTTADDLFGVALVTHVPTADGYLNIPNGDALLYVTQSGGTAGIVKTLKSKLSLPSSGIYELFNFTRFCEKIVSGYVESKNTDDNSIKIYNIFILSQDTAADEQIMRITIEMDSYGDQADAIPVSKRRGFSSRSSNTNVNARTTSSRFSKSSGTANANEFGFYKLTGGTDNDIFLKSTGYVGTSREVYSMFLNSDVLNPDYDNMVYADCNHAQSIRKASSFNPSGAANVFTGTPPTAGTVYNFIVNHGEGANQEYYYYDSTNDRIKKNAGTAWTDSTTLVDYDGAIIASKWYTASYITDIVLKMTGPVVIRKTYDNVIVTADPDLLNLCVIDIDNKITVCIEDTTVLDSIGDIDIQCFTNWWDYQGATNANIFENDICFNASKLAYKFYSKNRRQYECQVRDKDLGYIDYTLFDRMTIDSGILSAASGSPKFYVYGYSINCRNHEHKLTLLESVE